MDFKNIDKLLESQTNLVKKNYGLCTQKLDSNGNVIHVSKDDVVVYDDLYELSWVYKIDKIDYDKDNQGYGRASKVALEYIVSLYIWSKVLNQLQLQNLSAYALANTPKVEMESTDFDSVGLGKEFLNTDFTDFSIVRTYFIYRETVSECKCLDYDCVQTCGDSGC